MKFLRSTIILIAVVFVMPIGFAKAADDAVFSFVPDKASYAVGDTAKVDYVVDVGSYTNLSVVDFTIGISDISIIEPMPTNFFLPGTIFSQLGISSVSSNQISALVYINPDDKPASRSGKVGTFFFKALKEGSVNLTSEKIEATQEDKEDEWAITSSSQGTVRVGSSAGSTASSGTSSNTLNIIIPSATPTGQVMSSTSQVDSVNTGPELSIAISSIIGFAIYLFLRQSILKDTRKNEK